MTAEFVACACDAEGDVAVVEGVAPGATADWAVAAAGGVVAEGAAVPEDTELAIGADWTVVSARRLAFPLRTP